MTCPTVPECALLVEIRDLLIDVRRELRRASAFAGSSMSVADAAACLGVSRPTAQRWIDVGMLATVPHTGRRVLVARVELDRFAAGDTRRAGEVSAGRPG